MALLLGKRRNLRSSRHGSIEADGGWSEFTQKYLSNSVLRYAMRKGVKEVAAKTYWPRRFSTSLWQMAETSLQKRMNNPGFRTVAHLDN